MNLPADIAGIRYKWKRDNSQAWTDETFRAIVIRFLDEFLAVYSWAKSMEVEERFTDMGVNVRVPIGPTGPQEMNEGFLQRDGIPIIIVTAIRERDNRRFEVGLPFALATETPSKTLTAMLASGAVSLAVAERGTHGN